MFRGFEMWYSFCQGEQVEFLHALLPGSYYVSLNDKYAWWFDVEIQKAKDDEMTFRSLFEIFICSNIMDSYPDNYYGFWCDGFLQRVSHITWAWRSWKSMPVNASWVQWIPAMNSYRRLFLDDHFLFRRLVRHNIPWVIVATARGGCAVCVLLILNQILGARAGFSRCHLVQRYLQTAGVDDGVSGCHIRRSLARKPVWRLFMTGFKKGMQLTMMLRLVRTIVVVAMWSRQTDDRWIWKMPLGTQDAKWWSG